MKNEEKKKRFQEKDKSEKIKTERDGDFIWFSTNIRFLDREPIFYKSGFLLKNKDWRPSREAVYQQFIREIKMIRLEQKKKGII